MASGLDGFETTLVRTLLLGVYYNGESVYRQWNDAGTEVSFFSRKTKQCSNGGFKFIAWVPLLTVKISRSLTNEKRMAKMRAAQARVMRFKGITFAP